MKNELIKTNHHIRTSFAGFTFATGAAAFAAGEDGEEEEGGEGEGASS